MTANRSDIDRWIKTARQAKMKFIISVCDTFDYDDYPVYCKDEKELKKKKREYDNKSMQSINEIIEVK